MNFQFEPHHLNDSGEKIIPLKKTSHLPVSRLSRRIVFRVFISVIAIEAVIFTIFLSFPAQGQNCGGRRVRQGCRGGAFHGAVSQPDSHFFRSNRTQWPAADLLRRCAATHRHSRPV